MSSISRAHPPPLHSVPASFLLRSSTTSISSNSISTPVYSSFFFSPSVLFPSLPGSWVYSSSSLLLLTVYLLFPHRLWWRFEPFIAFAFLSLFFFFFWASLHSLLHSLVAILAEYPSRSLRWIVESKNQETSGGENAESITKRHWNEVRR